MIASGNPNFGETLRVGSGVRFREELDLIDGENFSAKIHCQIRDHAKHWRDGIA